MIRSATCFRINDPQRHALNNKLSTLWIPRYSSLNDKSSTLIKKMGSWLEIKLLFQRPALFHVEGFCFHIAVETNSEIIATAQKTVSGSLEAVPS